MIRILDRYVLREFLHYLLMGLLLFVGLFVVVDLFEKLDTFVDNGAKFLHVATYYLYGIPYILVLTTPIAMLLASLLALGQFSRTGEMAAMSSAGVSNLRVLQPVLVFALFVAGVSFSLAEWIMPEASVRRDQVLEEQIKDDSGTGLSRKRHVTYIGRGDRLYYIKTIDPRRRLLRDIVVQQFNRTDGRRTLGTRLDAREAHRSDGIWVFRSGFARNGMPEGEAAVHFKNFWTTRIAERIEDFVRVEPDPMLMGRGGLAKYIQRLRESSARTRKYEVEYHLKLAFPLINVIIVLVGTSISIRLRRTGMALGFGLSVFIGFTYYAFIRAGQAIGYNGGLPPLISAWLGNIVFFAMAMGFQVRANR